jgi:hypothetical protein
LKFFRSRILCTLVALFFLGMIAERAFGHCAPDPAKQAIETEHGESAQSGEHPCECVCHNEFVSEGPGQGVGAVASIDFFLVSDRADFPPDAIPFGIDHPPQIA